MNINKAKRLSKQLPPVPKKEIKVAERVEIKPIEVIPDEIEVTVEVEMLNPEPKPIIKKRVVAKKKPITKKELPVIVRNADIKTLSEVVNQMDVEELQLAGSPFGSSRTNNAGPYSFDDKFMAVSLMRAFAEDKEGKLIPNFTRLAALLGVAKDTLSSWWAQRESIISGSQGAVAEMKAIVTHQLTWMIMETASIVLKRLRNNPDKEKTENLIRIMDKMTNKITILNGEPGTRKRTDVYHHLPVKAIPPDYAG